MMEKTQSTQMDWLAGMRQMHVHKGPVSRKAQVGYFVLHTLEMCAAMCIGMAVLDPLYIWAAGLMGYSIPYLQLPELTALTLAFNMTVPMIAWMHFRGMNWRSINEMSAAMVIEAVLIIGAYWLGILSNVSVGGTSSLFLWQHSLMMPAMLIPMLFRLDVYTGKACH